MSLKRRAIYEFLDYKEYFNYRVSQLPKAGYGEYQKLAQALRVSTTMISQIFKGDKQLSLENASELSDYMGFKDEEADYFLSLVEYQKAGTHGLRQRLLKQINKRREAAQKLENRIQTETELSEADKTVFYSTWAYSGVRLLSDLGAFNEAKDIATRLNLPLAVVNKVLEFLEDKQLIIRDEKGQLKMGPTSTHIKAGSMAAHKHHQNWRLLGFQKMIHEDSKNLFITSPMVLSRDLADKIREDLPGMIEEILSKVPASKSEVVRCMNIDWFDY